MLHITNELKRSFWLLCNDLLHFFNLLSYLAFLLLILLLFALDGNWLRRWVFILLNVCICMLNTSFHNERQQAETDDVRCKNLED